MTQVAASAATDFVLLHVVADVALAAVGVQRDVGALEDSQELCLVLGDPRKRCVQRRKGGLLAEDLVESGSELGIVLVCRLDQFTLTPLSSCDYLDDANAPTHSFPGLSRPTPR